MLKAQSARLDRKKLFGDPVMVSTIVVLLIFLALFILQAVKKPRGGVGGAATPPTFIRIRRLCRRGGSLILLAKSIPYTFGRPLVGRRCFLEKVVKTTFSTR